MTELTAGDWARYAFLVVLASLVFLVVYGNREGAFISLLAVYLVGGALAALVVRIRKDRA